jgi:hypothetical protein
MLLDSYFKIGVISVFHFAAISWLLLDRQSLVPTFVFVACVALTWIVEIVTLNELLSRLGVHQKARRQEVFGAYVVAWFLQLTGGLVFFAFMKVHTLPAAFEIAASTLAVTALFYAIRRCIKPVRDERSQSGELPMKWWELGASAATLTPTANLIGILACKACGVF